MMVSLPDASQIFLIIHLFGAMLGVGSATVSHVLFHAVLRDKYISKDELSMLRSSGKIVRIGLHLSILSGLGLFLSQYLSSGSFVLAFSAAFQAKMTMVFIIFLNGFLYKKSVIPFLIASYNKQLDSTIVQPGLPKVAIANAISLVTWYSVFLLGALLRSMELPYVLIMNGYILILLGGVIMEYYVLTRIFTETTSNNPAMKKSVLGRICSFTTFYILFACIGLFLVFSGIPFRQKLPVRNTHYICIHESPAWFRPDVKQIRAGDTVIWKHCVKDESSDASAGDHDDRIIHTHPILAIKGPEKFSSNFRPIGALKENDGFSFTFTKKGIYEYLCPTHPYMKGIIAVDEKPQKSTLWPPEEIIQPDVPPPSEPGIGEIWLDTQFEVVPNKQFPGTITIIDTDTWDVQQRISDDSFNNPHNIWHSYDGKYMFQTQWHGNGFSKIDAKTKTVLQTITIGNAPAHVFVHPKKDRIYVSLNNENIIKILNHDLEVVGDIQTPFGPHGIWIDPSGKWMSVASTLDGKLSLVDLEKEAVVQTFDAPGLPLAAAITHDAKYAMISLLLEGKVRVIDIESMQQVKDIPVGSLPIWPAPSPDGTYVYVPNSGSASISVISLDTLSVVKTLPAASGAHGIIFGRKKGGGYYGYFSNKFARAVGVIDVQKQETVGYIRLGDTAWGGNGIDVIPNTYDSFISN